MAEEEKQLIKNTDSVQMRGIYSEGFGIISKKVMQDKRLDCDTKAVYAYLCSCTGGGYGSGFVKRKDIEEDLDIAGERLNRCLGVLIELNYISTTLINIPLGGCMNYHCVYSINAICEK